MAESCNIAFGRYLKTLRERRGLSLEDVQSLSQTFPDGIKKAYLSRCENGRLPLALSKLIPLSRIYEVPSDVLVERMELDMELERLGGPDTKGLTFAELRAAGISAGVKGDYWTAYAFFRDGLESSDAAPLLEEYRSLAEQSAIARINLATVTRALGKHRLFLNETLAITKTDALGDKFRPLLLERLAVGYQKHNDFHAAAKSADLAIEAAKCLGDAYPLGFAYSTRADIAIDEKDTEKAIAYHQEAYRWYTASNRDNDRARTMNNLAQIYFELGRWKSARSAANAAIRLLRSRSCRAVALGKLLLGEIDTIEGKHQQAAQQWKEALLIADQFGDRTLRFKVEYQFYKQARALRDVGAARSLHRRLSRLASWVPPDTPELGDFKASAD